MKDKSLLMKLISVIAGVIYIIFGIVMIQNPVTTLLTLSLVMAWVVILSGIVAIIIGFMFKGVDDYLKRSNIADGVLLLALGLILLFGNFISNSLILAYLLIIWIIMDSAFQLQLTALIPTTGLKVIVIIFDVLIIMYAIWLMFNPNAAEGFLVLYTGFAFIVTGVVKMMKNF